MNLSVVQLFYLLALFWQKSSHALPALYPGSGLLNSGQNWLQSLLSQSLTADPANSFLATLQSRQETEKRTIPGTNINLSSVDKPEEIWTNRWENTLGESKLYGNMVGDLLKGVIRAAGWLQLDLILYGPRTILNSFNNLFR